MLKFLILSIFLMDGPWVKQKLAHGHCAHEHKVILPRYAFFGTMLVYLQGQTRFGVKDFIHLRFCLDTLYNAG